MTTKTQYNLNSLYSRQELIRDLDSSIYTGINEYGEDVIIKLEKGQSMEVWTRRTYRPNRYEVISFGSDGFAESISYEPVEDHEQRVRC